MILSSLNFVLTCVATCLITIFGGIIVVINYCRQPELIEEEALLMAEM